MIEIFKQLAEKYNLSIEQSVNLDVRNYKTVRGLTAIYKLYNFEHTVFNYYSDSIRIFDRKYKNLRIFDKSNPNCYIVLDEIIDYSIRTLKRYYTNERIVEQTDRKI